MRVGCGMIWRREGTLGETASAGGSANLTLCSELMPLLLERLWITLVAV